MAACMEEPLVGSCAMAMQPARGPVASGYLAVQVGDFLEILYVGSGDDAGWLYARTATGQDGWLPRGAIEPGFTETLADAAHPPASALPATDAPAGPHVPACPPEGGVAAAFCADVPAAALPAAETHLGPHAPPECPPEGGSAAAGPADPSASTLLGTAAPPGAEPPPAPPREGGCLAGGVADLPASAPPAAEAPPGSAAAAGPADPPASAPPGMAAPPGCCPAAGVAGLPASSPPTAEAPPGPPGRDLPASTAASPSCGLPAAELPPGPPAGPRGGDSTAGATASPSDALAATDLPPGIPAGVPATGAAPAHPQGMGWTAGAVPRPDPTVDGPPGTCAAAAPPPAPGGFCRGEKLFHRRVGQAADAPQSWLRYRPTESEVAPKTSPPPARMISNGQRVTVISCDGKWVFVRTSGRDAEQGWIRESYLHRVDPAADQGAPCQKPSRAPPLPPPTVKVGPGGAAEHTLRRTVRIFTFGLETLDNTLVDFCQDFDRQGAEAIVPEVLLREVLGRRVNTRVDMLCDARVFSDPGSSNLSGHIGQHPDILSRISAMAAFPRWVEDVKAHVAHRLGGSAEASVAFYCKSGKHRSVACAWFLQHFCKHEGWDCEVRHLCQSSWHRTCRGMCEECREPSTRSDQRELALDRALQWWQRAGVK
uniref:RapZ C-terminal domain-containing protein n=1 Tax=Alexandrium monilatum TaxID=311494 RepID=A0A7S4SS05_9DINO